MRFPGTSVLGLPVLRLQCLVFAVSVFTSSVFNARCFYGLVGCRLWRLWGFTAFLGSTQRSRAGLMDFAGFAGCPEFRGAINSST